MGLHWGYECDIWSIGCILLELSVGCIGFDASDPVEHLFLIQEMVGEIPRRMWDACTRAELKGFVREGRIRGEAFPRDVQAGFPRMRKVGTMLEFHRDLADLAMWTLCPDPSKRPRCDEILRHPFLR
jgi:dual-specificity kinase